MAAEVVGSAYVTIRAVTTKLASDIKDGIDKGVAGADVDKIGKDIGDRIGASIRDGISNSGALDAAANAGQQAGQSLADGIDKGVADADVPGSLGKELDKAAPNAGASGKKVGYNLGVAMRQAAIGELAKRGPADWIDASINKDKSKIQGSFRKLFASFPDFGSAFKKIVPDNLFSNFFAKLKPQTDGEGGGLGRRFADAFTGGFFKANPLTKLLSAIKVPPLAAIAILAVPAIGGALKIIANLAISVVAQIGYVATAAAGAGVAVGALGAGVAAGILPIALALKAQTPALAEFKKSAGEVGKVWQKVGAATQLTLLPALTDALNISKQLVPAFSQYGIQIGAIAGNTAKLAAGVLTTSTSQGYLNNILNGSVGIWTSLQAAVINVVNAVLPFLSSAQPIAQRLADSIANVTAKFSFLINAGAQTGTLGDTLKLWYDRAELIVKGFGDILVAIWNTFKIGADTAQPFFDTFSNFAQKWRDFTSSATGQSQIAGYFNNAAPVMSEVAGLLKDIFNLIVTPIGKGDNSGIVSFIKSVRTDILPSLATLASTLSKNSGPALQNFFNVLVNLITKLSESGALGAFLGTLTPALSTFIGLLDNPVFAKILPPLLQLLGTFKALDTLTFGGFSKGLGGIIGLVKKFAIAPAIEAGVTAFVAAEGTLMGGIAAFGSALWAAVAPILPIIGVIALIIGAIIGIVWAFKNWDKIKEWVSKAWEAITTFFKELPDKIANGAKALWEWLQNAIPIAVQKAKDFFTAVGNFLITLPGKIGEWVAGAAEAIGGFLGRAIPWLVQNVPKFLLTVYKFIYIELPSKIIGWLVNAVTALFSWIVDAIPQIGYWLGYAIGWIASFLISLPGKIVGWLVGAVTALFQWIVDAVPKVLEWLGNLLTTIGSFLATLPGYIIGFVAGAAVALIQWLIDAVPKAAEWLGKMIITIAGFLISLPGKIGGWLLSAATAVIGWLVDTIPKLPGKLAEFAGKIFDWAVGFIRDLPGKFASIGDKMLEVGKDVVKGIWNGIKDLGGWIKDRISDFAGGIVKGFKDAFKINSPSKLMASTVGSPIVEGIAFGMDKAYDKWMPDAINGITDKMTSDFGTIPVGFAALTPGQLSTATSLTTSGVITAGSQVVNLQVTIGDRDITDIVDSQIVDYQTAYSQRVYSRGVN